MTKSRARKDAGDDDVLFDAADVRDASTFESQSGRKGSARSFLRIVQKVVRRKRFWLALVLFGLAVLLYALRQYGYFAPDSIVWFLKSHPVIAPVVFAVAYAVMVMCLVPTLPLNLGAGLIWGPYWGGLLTVIGAGTGSALAFLAARYLASDYLNRKFGNSAWTWLREEMQRKEWKAVAFTRINPIFPFGPSSYFFGLTRIKFSRYIVTTLLSIAPLCILFAAIGSSIGGIVLHGDAYTLVKDMLAISLAVTLLVALKMAVKKFSQ
ncbi:TVP38/TMEM64 family protein [Sulfuricaulis sp.]|uniref:TVP38/TMEM64 family protein n=1 Tax=Sulfuricaulis sp. TaxID=2003553 RepID=UPI00355A0316